MLEKKQRRREGEGERKMSKPDYKRGEKKDRGRSADYVGPAKRVKRKRLGTASIKGRDADRRDSYTAKKDRSSGNGKKQEESRTTARLAGSKWNFHERTRLRRCKLEERGGERGIREEPTKKKPSILQGHPSSQTSAVTKGRETSHGGMKKGV